MKNFNLFINENVLKQKSVDKEFDIIKTCKFNTLRNLTLEDIVKDWKTVQNIENDNIDTIKYFVNNPKILKGSILIYDDIGLSDGYHRLIAMKIVGLKTFSYKIEDKF